MTDREPRGKPERCICESKYRIQEGCPEHDVKMRANQPFGWVLYRCPLDGAPLTMGDSRTRSWFCSDIHIADWDFSLHMEASRTHGSKPGHETVTLYEEWIMALTALQALNACLGDNTYGIMLDNEEAREEGAQIAEKYWEKYRERYPNATL